MVIQDVVDLARVPLNDADKTRYSDSDLLRYAQDALLAVYRLRPDLYYGRYDTLPDHGLALSSRFPLDEAYLAAVADYVTARASTVDAEYVVNGRASLFAQMFTGGLT